MTRVISGPGFEIHERLGVLWARVWWAPTEDQPAFARPVLNLLGPAFAAPGRSTLVLDLREAPPVAHFGARVRLGAILAAAEEHGVPTSVVVGPTEIQARDMHGLVRRHAPALGQVVAASILDELPRCKTDHSDSGFRRLAA